MIDLNQCKRSRIVLAGAMVGLRRGPVWRIAPSGTQQVWLLRLEGKTAQVCGPGTKRRWSERSMTVAAADLFATKAEAKAEYRRRRAAALAADPAASLNLTSDIG